MKEKLGEERISIKFRIKMWFIFRKAKMKEKTKNNEFIK